MSAEPSTPREHPDVLEREDWNRATSLAIYWKGQAELAEQARDDAIAAVVSERVERRRLERELEELRGSAPDSGSPTPQIEVGQRWRSLDPRDEGLMSEVLRVEPTQVRIQRFRKTWVNRDRFVRHYELVDASSLDSERP